MVYLSCLDIPPPPSPVCQDENTVERVSGDCSLRKRYSHIDLLYMVDGVETQQATVVAGNRCYYLKVGADVL